jgi:colanic acid/amylovoran biosynthesis glycosyltransferase
MDFPPQSTDFSVNTLFQTGGCPTMSTLVMLSPAPVIEAPGDEVVLDSRFVEGMNLHCQLWPGPVICVMRRGAAVIPDGVRYAVRRLGFELILADHGQDLPPALLDSASLVYCAADDMRYLDLAQAMRGRIGRLVYTVDQSLSERLASARDARLSLRRQFGSVAWNLRREGRLRLALTQADGVHLNGLAAAASYGRRNPNTLIYMDNRIRQTMLARSEDQAERARRLTSGAPLRLIAVAPLDPGSGTEDLLPVALLLKNRGIAFDLDIFGRGPLAQRLLDGIAALGLGDCVHLAPPGSFEGQLLPHLRRHGDLALMPRRVPEGPGPYLEAMGCGLPVIGYGSASWRRMARASGAGWVTEAWPGTMATQIAALHADRARLVAASDRAVAYAVGTTFEKVFARRMGHLRDLARLD